MLYRHLRTINTVLIPAGYGDDEDRPLPRASAAPASAFGETPTNDTHEAAQFCHAGGDVLAEVIPVLDEPQFARLFGPARQLVFIASDHPAEDGSILYEAPLPQDAPAPGAGMLRLDREQLIGLEASRLERSRRKVMNYLREVDPDSTDGLSNRDLHKMICTYEESGEAYGSQSERAQMKWAYMMSIANGEIGKQKETREFFADSKKRPDDRIDDLMDVADEA